jgi:glutathione S-transferase
MQQLGIPFKRQSVDLTSGIQYGDAFRKMNPNSKVPVLQIGEDVFLSESNAMLWYLAEGTRLLPSSRLAHAQVLQWMFFEQYSHEPYIATVRFWLRFSGNPDAYRADIDRCRPRGYKALEVMEKHLQQHLFFVENQYSIADIALYAYTHTAHEGLFEMQRFPAIKAWLGRVEQTPGYVAITA